MMDKEQTCQFLRDMGIEFERVDHPAVCNMAEMAKIDDCLNCGQCSAKCPYELDTPRLLRDNYADYKRVLAGETKVD